MILKPYTNGAAGTVAVPGSKSITNRALLLAALADGVSELTGVLESDDAAVMINALTQLGVEVKQSGESSLITGSAGAFPHRGDGEIFVGNAGTATRFLTAALGLAEGTWRLHGKERMHQRPIGDLLQALDQIGVSVVSEAGNNCLPLSIKGKGGIRDGRCQIKGDISSQYLSALLLICLILVALLRSSGAPRLSEDYPA